MLCFRLLYAIVLSSDVFDARARFVCVCVCVCMCVVHWHCTAQLSMFNMEKRFRNKIIIMMVVMAAVVEVVEVVMKGYWRSLRTNDSSRRTYTSWPSPWTRCRCS